MPSVKTIETRAPRAGARQRTLSRVVQARRRLEAPQRDGGRAWINGREVGGPDARFRHLGQSYD